MEENVKSLVQDKYAEIALQSREVNLASCCGSGGCSTNVYNIMADDYTQANGYNPDADLGLGCGLPVQFAQIKKGDTVVDLGSGAGNDCFVARAETGETGKVLGIDFTPAMVTKARYNAATLGYNNIEFRQGDIEDMPVTANYADVMVSNCVLNLVPNKHKAFSEMYRVLKPGGHFSISDIVTEGQLPAQWREVAELYAGCITGAVTKDAYLDIIKEAGFENITLQKEKEILLPDDILQNYFSAEEIAGFKTSGASIKSITVFAQKPAKDDRNCCTPGSGCC